MRRSSVLGIVVQECKKQGVTGLLGELLIRPAEGEVRAKRRSVFVVGATEDDIQRIQEECRQTLEDNHNFTYEISSCTHGTIENPAFSEQLIPVSDSKLENNWRNRIIRINQIDFTAYDQIQKLVLTATWRLVVTRRGLEFFTRHDIFPLIWSPGFSVGASADLQSPIQNEVDYFKNRQSRLFDDHNDVVKLYAGSDGGVFQELAVDGNQQLRIPDIQLHPDVYRDNILAALHAHFQ